MNSYHDSWGLCHLHIVLLCKGSVSSVAEVLATMDPSAKIHCLPCHTPSWDFGVTPGHETCAFGSRPHTWHGGDVVAQLGSLVIGTKFNLFHNRCPGFLWNISCQASIISWDLVPQNQNNRLTIDTKKSWFPEVPVSPILTLSPTQPPTSRHLEVSGRRGRSTSPASEPTICPWVIGIYRGSIIFQHTCIHVICVYRYIYIIQIHVKLLSTSDR